MFDDRRMRVIDIHPKYFSSGLTITVRNRIGLLRRLCTGVAVNLEMNVRILTLVLLHKKTRFLNSLGQGGVMVA